MCADADLTKFTAMYQCDFSSLSTVTSSFNVLCLVPAPCVLVSNKLIRHQHGASRSFTSFTLFFLLTALPSLENDMFVCNNAEGKLSLQVTG